MDTCILTQYIRHIGARLGTLLLVATVCFSASYGQSDSIEQQRRKGRMEVYRYNIHEIIYDRWQGSHPGSHILGPFVIDGENYFGFGSDYDSTRLERYLREDPATADIVREFGFCLIHSAIVQNRWDLAVQFIARGADPNHRDGLGRTPLFQTSSRNRADFLLQHGADPNARDDQGCPLLHFAIDSHWEQLAGALLDAGADVNATWEGWTALDLAIAQNCPALADAIRRHGGISTGKGPIFGAILHGDAAELERILMLEEEQIAAALMDGTTPLHIAALDSNPELARILLRHNAPVDARDDEHETPLHWAAHTGNARVVALLLEHGADPNARNEYGMTPLWERRDWDNTVDLLKYSISFFSTPITPAFDSMEAMMWRRLERNRRTVAALLLRHGADVDAIDYGNETPLCQAARVDLDPAIVRMFLEYGAEVNVRNTNGDTPLHTAAEEGSVEMLRLLLRHGADLDARNDQGETPLYRIIFRGELHEYPDRMAALKLLLRNGANPNIPDNEGETPLSLVSGDTTLERLLRRHGAIR